MTTFAEELEDLNAEVVDTEDGFGEIVQTPAGDMSCVFDYPTVRLQLARPGTEKSNVLEAEARDPVLHLRDNDAAQLAKGQQVTLRGQSFDLASDPRPDGGGMTSFLLVESQETDPTGATPWR